MLWGGKSLLKGFLHGKGGSDHLAPGKSSAQSSASLKLPPSQMNICVSVPSCSLDEVKFWQDAILFLQVFAGLGHTQSLFIPMHPFFMAYSCQATRGWRVETALACRSRSQSTEHKVTMEPGVKHLGHQNSSCKSLG